MILKAGALYLGAGYAMIKKEAPLYAAARAEGRKA
jgi:hypothetical protein